MKINIQYDASTSAAPAGFFTAVDYAVGQIETLIADDLTVTINFGWGEANGEPIPSDSLGYSLRYGNYVPYDLVKGALQTHAASADDLTAVASLPADPSGGAGVGVSLALQLALGLTPSPSSPPVVGYVGLSTAHSYAFDPSQRAVPGAFDATGVLLHEITEVLGRASLVDQNRQDILDLFRYSASGVHSFANAGGWFSVDGTHLLLPFNDPSNGGDAGDWTSSVGADAFVQAGPGGRQDLLSTVDLRALDVIGYRLAKGTAVDGSPLPMAYELDGSAGGDSLTGSASADFIRGMDGNDTIVGGAGADDVNGNKGDDLVVGADGADYVRGGQGNDTVYGDAGDDPHVNGNLGDDIVHGGSGNDTVFGGQGNDTVYGDDGDDVISGDLGNDALFGGPGADRFVFRPGSGADWIGDFSSAGGDRIVLPAGTAYAITTYQGQAVILFGNGDSVGLTGVSPAQMGDWLVYA